MKEQTNTEDRTKLSLEEILELARIDGPITFKQIREPRYEGHSSLQDFYTKKLGESVVVEICYAIREYLRDQSIDCKIKVKHSGTAIATYESYPKENNRRASKDPVVLLFNEFEQTYEKQKPLSKASKQSEGLSEVRNMIERKMKGDN